MNTNENILGYEKLSKLLKTFAIPSIIAMIVSSLYNIVDQIFIGQGVGYLGNAATNVSYPLTTICLSIALLIGIGSASRFSLYLGAEEPEKAAKVVGDGISMMIFCGIIYAILIEIFIHPMLIAFGATEQIMSYAIDYTRITALGMPFLIVTNGISNLARADGSPKYSMNCMLVGAIINTLLDPIFIFPLGMGVRGAAIATVIGQFFSFLMAIRYIPRLSRKAESFPFWTAFQEMAFQRIPWTEQLSESVGNHRCSNCAEQFFDLLWSYVNLWKGYPPGCLRNCHEDKFSPPSCHHWNFPGTSAHCGIQLRCPSI